MVKYNKRVMGGFGEDIAIKHYVSLGRTVIKKNYYIRGGEIDCIFENKTIRCFVEVKIVNTIQDLSGYITKKKLGTIKRAVWSFNNKNPTRKYLRMDVVFIRKNRIVHLFENITM